jgi:mannose-6-phosphate isomerase-like protein (cupin superfamily)
MEYRSPTTGTVMRRVEDTSQRLVFERRYVPDTGKGPQHVHGDFEHRFECLEGVAVVEVGEERRELRAGEATVVPPATAHSDPYNASDVDAVVRWTITPQTEFVRRYARLWLQCLVSGRLNRQDEMSALQIMVLLDEGDHASHVAGPPVVVALQRFLLPVIGLFGRLLGLRADYR